VLTIVSPNACSANCLVLSIQLAVCILFHVYFTWALGRDMGQQKRANISFGGFFTSQ
jgi:hypothetical protein